MNEFELLGPTAWNSCGTAQLKAVAEDFQVEEVLDIALTGGGEHLWLWVEKRYLNTEEVAKRLAKAIQVPLRQVSYAGLKDRLALTRQWFSVHLPGKENPDLSCLKTDQLSILKTVRHQRKLQRGAHSANRFIIQLRDLKADTQMLEERLHTIANQGVPNYYGLQRFGIDGGNVRQALDFATQETFPEQRGLRSRLLSSARSYLFNKVLAARVADKTWNTILNGDILSFTDSKSYFPALQMVKDDPRFELLDIHPTGCLWGEGELASSDDVLQKELAVQRDYCALASWLSLAKMRQERRVLRLPVRALTWQYSDPTILHLSFTLPAGCFATAVVRELVTLAETDDKCIF